MWHHHDRAWIWHGVEMRCPGRSRIGRDSLTPRRRNRSGYFRMWRRRGRWEMWQLRAGEPERASQPWASRIWQRRRPWGLYPAFRSMRRRSAGHRYVKVVVANAWSVRENELASRFRDRCDVVFVPRTSERTHPRPTALRYLSDDEVMICAATSEFTNDRSYIICCNNFCIINIRVQLKSFI